MHPGAFLTFCLLFLTQPLLADQQASSNDRNWFQPFANAAGTSYVSVEAVKTEPQETWRHSYEALLSAPVVWDGVLYQVAREGKKSKLLAIRIATGETITEVNLKSAEEYWVGVWQGTVSVLAPHFYRGYSLRKNKFKAGAMLRGEFNLHALLGDGIVFVPSVDGPTLLVDAVRGKQLATVELGKGTPALLGDRLASLDIRKKVGYSRRNLTLDFWKIIRDGRKLSTEYDEIITSGIIRRKRGQEESDDAYVIAISNGRKSPKWFVKSPLPLASTSGHATDSALLPGLALSWISKRPAVWSEQIFGFSLDGIFTSQRLDGKYMPIVAEEDLPPGATVGAISISNGVAYLGNWAVDLATQSVLWCLPEMKVLGPVVPAADGVFIYRTPGHELVCCHGAAAGGDVHLATASHSSIKGIPSVPGSSDGLISNQGQRIVGMVESLESGQFQLTTETGEVHLFEADEVAYVESNGERTLIGDEYPVFVAWRSALQQEFYSMLEKQFEAHLKVRVMNGCRRLVQEAIANGMPSERSRLLDEKMAGKRRVSKGNLEPTLVKLETAEKAAREKLQGRYIEASAWCQAAGLGSVATVILADANEIQANSWDIERATRKLIPESFPFRNLSNAAQLWRDWSVELLPAGAEFIATDHPLWKRTKGTLWARDAYGLRTRNIILLVRSRDEKIVGSSLRNAEGTIRTLQFLLGEGVLEERRARLQVRIHNNKRDFSEIPNTQGYLAMPWMAGYYSPTERISRFYIPGLDDPMSGQEREFQRTLTHELTHQYLSQRWLPAESTVSGEMESPGYWIVEGFATFIEGQLMELGKPSMGFNDPRVRSLDFTAQIADRLAFTKPQDLVKISHDEFNDLDGEKTIAVQLQNTLHGVKLSERAGFYQQAGSLVFFMMNRRGSEGRAKLIEYMRKYYLNTLDQPGWQSLGFDSPEDLEIQFRTFLKGIL